MIDLNEARELLRKAEHYRRLALYANDDEIAEKLIALAEEYEAKAAGASEAR